MNTRLIELEHRSQTLSPRPRQAPRPSRRAGALLLRSPGYAPRTTDNIFEPEDHAGPVPCLRLEVAVLV
ncbi:MAG TPA: hypothetical protein VGF67_19735 [Ktedonobacteraceae bacterium]